MRKYWYLSIASLLLGVNVVAQNPTNDKFENLKLNSSPAYVVLGIEPENIQRPSSPAKLVGALQNAVVDGTLKPNYGLEFSPYLLKHPVDSTDNRFNAYAMILEKGGFATTFWRSLSVSIGTSTTGKDVFGSLKPGTGLGIGARALLIDGHPSETVLKWWNNHLKDNYVQSVKGVILSWPQATITDLEAIFSVTEHDFKEITLKNHLLNTLSDKDITDLFGQVRRTAKLAATQSNNDKTAINASLNNFSYASDEDNALGVINSGKTPFAKEGFMLELAAGNAFVFQDNTIDGAVNAKLAVWLTPSYRVNLSKDAKKVSLRDYMAVFRYTRNNQQAGIDQANYLDAGLKFGLTEGDFSASLEGIGRYASNLPSGQKKKYTYRASLGMNYKISDLFTLTFNFGTNFDGNTATYSDPKKIFAVGGLNVGLPLIKTK